MSMNTFSKRTEIDLRSIQLRSILVWKAPQISFDLDRSQFAFERSYSDRFRLRPISVRIPAFVFRSSSIQIAFEKFRKRCKQLFVCYPVYGTCLFRQQSGTTSPGSKKLVFAMYTKGLSSITVKFSHRCETFSCMLHAKTALNSVIAL